ncbi:phage protein [Streptococcus pneumoniae]|nr:phage protein [Streptococcus pneumoniae]
MFSLSRESEHDLTHGILEVVERYLEAREKVPPRLTKLINLVTDIWKFLGVDE